MNKLLLKNSFVILVFIFKTNDYDCDGQ